jgi:hypothetical protein
MILKSAGSNNPNCVRHPAVILIRFRNKLFSRRYGELKTRTTRLLQRKGGNFRGAGVVASSWQFSLSEHGKSWGLRKLGLQYQDNNGIPPAMTSDLTPTLHTP